MRNSLMTVGVIVTALSVAPACATKKFVRTSVGEVNDKVTSQGKTLEETQERVRVAEGRITETDAKATAAGALGDRKANTAAARSGEQATEVGRTAEARAAGIEGEMRKLIFETVLSEDRGQFKLGKAELPETRPARLDTMVGPAQGRQEGRLGRDRRPHRQHRRQEDQRARSAWSAPKP